MALLSSFLVRAGSIDTLWSYQLDPVIHDTDAAAVFRMPATETLCVDDLLARTAGGVLGDVAAIRSLALTLDQRVKHGVAVVNSTTSDWDGYVTLAVSGLPPVFMRAGLAAIGR